MNDKLAEEKPPKKQGSSERLALSRIREILSGEQPTAEKIDEFTRLILAIEPDPGNKDASELLKVLGMDLPQEIQEMNEAFDAMTEKQKQQFDELRARFRKEMAAFLEEVGAPASLVNWFAAEPAAPMWRP